MVAMDGLREPRQIPSDREDEAHRRVPRTVAENPTWVRKTRYETGYTVRPENDEDVISYLNERKGWA